MSIKNLDLCGNENDKEYILNISYLNKNKN